MRPILAATIVVLSAACERQGVTAPTTPAAPAFGVAGGVFDTTGHPLAQARVEVIDGPRKGIVATTDAAGAFVFEPIFTSAFELRASKEGHREQSKRISSAQSDGSFALELELRGQYEITFAADAACTGLPGAVRTRTYSASFDSGSQTSTGAIFYFVTLSGADFERGSSGYPDWNVLYVSEVGGVAHVYLSDPPLWEHLTRGPGLTPLTDLVIDGEAAGTVGVGTSQWSLTGTFTYCPAAESDAYPECQVPEISCRSQNHQLTLTRKAIPVR